MPEIEPLIKQVVDEAADGYTGLCILLESRTDASRWVQLTWDNINAAYPYGEEPLSKVQKMGLPLFPGIEVAAWKPEIYATFEHPAEPTSEIAAFVVAYLDKVLGISSATQDLRVEEQHL